MTTIAQVTSIDLNGLNGRFPHPEPQHEGRVGRVLRSWTEEGEDYGLGLTFYEVELGLTEVFIFADYEVEISADPYAQGC
jgi:hypothetical protein